MCVETILVVFKLHGSEQNLMSVENKGEFNWSQPG